MSTRVYSIGSWIGVGYLATGFKRRWLPQPLFSDLQLIVAITTRDLYGPARGWGHGSQTRGKHPHGVQTNAAGSQNDPTNRQVFPLAAVFFFFWATKCRIKWIFIEIKFPEQEAWSVETEGLPVAEAAIGRWLDLKGSNWSPRSRDKAKSPNRGGREGSIELAWSTTIAIGLATKNLRLERPEIWSPDLIKFQQANAAAIAG